MQYFFTSSLPFSSLALRSTLTFMFLIESFSNLFLISAKNSWVSPFFPSCISNWDVMKLIIKKGFYNFGYKLFFLFFSRLSFLERWSSPSPFYWYGRGVLSLSCSLYGLRGLPVFSWRRHQDKTFILSLDTCLSDPGSNYQWRWGILTSQYHSHAISDLFLRSRFGWSLSIIKIEIYSNRICFINFSYWHLLGIFFPI